jgi:hypothetical protein
VFLVLNFAFQFLSGGHRSMPINKNKLIPRLLWERLDLPSQTLICTTVNLKNAGIIHVVQMCIDNGLGSPEKFRLQQVLRSHWRIFMEIK